jgi:uncharacterized protein YbjT (DUF2867 family)
MIDAVRESRTAILAGATGLVGRALLPRLLQERLYRRVHALLRRVVPEIKPGDKLEVHRVDFANLPATFPASDDVYIALGTTIKAAGSQLAFRLVDFDFVVNTARAARVAGARRLAVVSALGADAGSRVFYNRVKGEMQEAVAALGYDSVVIVQPSLLLGDRAALGQPARAGERWVARLLGPARLLMPRAVRPIEAHTVAAAMVAALRDPRPGVRLLKSGDMQASDRH